MSAHSERTLLQHLTDLDSVSFVVEEGVPPYILPTEELRAVLGWAVDYYHDSGCERVPSVVAMSERWGDLLADHEVDIEEEPEDSIEWAIADLKADYVMLQGNHFVKGFATTLHEAEPEHRIGVLREAADDLISSTIALERKADQADVRERMGERLRAYEQRRERGHHFDGMTLGFSEVDEHTGGIRDGELAVLAAPPKTGKSLALLFAALRDWEAGRTPVLFTLENSVDMTLDRLACLAERVSASLWGRGECHPADVERVEKFVERVTSADHPLWVLQPPAGRRTIEHMVREAMLRGADSLYIDQLTFVEAPDERLARWLQIRDVMHRLKESISTGRKRMPCLLAHQVNREGVKAAHKTGYLQMEHMAEGSEVERTADWVFGLYRSWDDEHARQAKLQMLAARRTSLLNWALHWDVDNGSLHTEGQVVLG